MAAILKNKMAVNRKKKKILQISTRSMGTHNNYYAKVYFLPFQSQDPSPPLKHLSYVERLKKLKLPCLKYRRIRGDLIEVYKIITGSYDEHILKNILKTKEDSGVRHSRRGHNFMLRTQTYKTKYRKNFFSLRITNIWNKLPHHVVNASSLNSFKNSVDRYFISSNMYYDYKFKPEAEQQLWKQDSSDHIGREG